MAGAELKTQLRVAGAIRRVGALGGVGTVVKRGDPDGGGLLVLCLERGRPQALLERVLGERGDYRPAMVGPGAEDPQQLEQYLARRLKFDPDLWLIELDIADSQRFAAELLLH